MCAPGPAGKRRFARFWLLMLAFAIGSFSGVAQLLGQFSTPQFSPSQLGPPPNGPGGAAPLSRGLNDQVRTLGAVPTDVRGGKEPLEVRLRVDWGATEALPWVGEIEIDSGRLGDLRSLGTGGDVPGNKWIASQRKIMFRSVTPSTYDGLDLSVFASTEARITVRIVPEGWQLEPRTFTYLVGDVMKGQESEPLSFTKGGGDKNAQNKPIEGSLVVRRSPGDLLRIRLPDGPLIFEPNEEVNWEILPSRPGLDANEDYRCSVKLREARNGRIVEEYETVAKTDAEGIVAAINVRPLTVPAEEGVYTLSVSLRRSGLPSSFLRRGPEISGEVQFVALSSSRPATSTTTWDEIVRIEPSQPDERVWLQLPSIPGIPTLQGERPVHNGSVSISNREGRAFTELEENGWVAYPIRVADLGRPHIVEITYPATSPQTLSVGLIEPNLNGSAARIAMESGVDVTRSVGPDDVAVRYHRWVVWPGDANPWLLIANRRSDSSAAFGSIRILAGPENLPAAKSIRVGERRLAAFYDGTRFVESHNATEAYESGSNHSFDDWVTYYEAANRMIEHMRFSGYNTLVVNVYSDGTSLYPSTQLQPTPQWDTGVFFSSGQHPRHKDILELLFRLCDREGMRLVPSFDFNARLPEVELARRQKKPVYLIGDNVPSSRYNVLNPRVQTAVRRVLDEVNARYSWHPSFDGLAIKLAEKSFMPLPGFASPLDDETLDRFQARTQIQVPRAPKMAERGQFLFSDPRRRATWLQWRADEFASFVQSISDDLHRSKADAVLLLLANDLLDAPTVRVHLSGDNSRIDSAFLLHGIDSRRLSRLEGVTMLKPQTIRSEVRLGGYAADFKTAISAEFDEYFSGDEFQRSVQSPTGASFFHATEKLSLPDFDDRDPLKLGESNVSFQTRFTPSGEENRRRFVQSLAFSDLRIMVDGGTSLATGQAEALRSLFDAYRDLPDKPFRRVVPQANEQTQPVVVRQLVDGDKTYFYLINDSSWTCRVEVDLGECDPNNLTVLGQRSVPPPRRIDGRTLWTIELEPYDLFAVSHFGVDLKIAQWRVTLPEYVIPELTQRLRDLNIRADTRREKSLLQNPGFEQQGAGRTIPGWDSRQGEGIHTSLTESGHTGRLALRLSRETMTDDLWVDSNAFSPPQTGSLYVSVWLKVDDAEKQPPLRVAIFDRNEYYRMIPIGAGAGVTKLTESWKQFLFQFREIPSSNLQELRLGFDLMGPGTVYVDEVQIFDLYVNDDQRKRFKLSSNDLGARLASPQFDVRDCEQFLNGYWPKYLSRHMPVGRPNERMASRPPQNSEPNKDLPKGALRRMKDALPKINFRRDELR